ncbi:hypothetical protein ABH927_001349 [Planotetraspora sp. GP83]
MDVDSGSAERFTVSIGLHEDFIVARAAGELADHLRTELISDALTAAVDPGPGRRARPRSGRAGDRSLRLPRPGTVELRGEKAEAALRMSLALCSSAFSLRSALISSRSAVDSCSGRLPSSASAWRPNRATPHGARPDHGRSAPSGNRFPGQAGQRVRGVHRGIGGVQPSWWLLPSPADRATRSCWFQGLHETRVGSPRSVSRLREAWKLSQAALSALVPTAPMDWVTPSRRHRAA